MLRHNKRVVKYPSRLTQSPQAMPQNGLCILARDSALSCVLQGKSQDESLTSLASVLQVGRKLGWVSGLFCSFEVLSHLPQSTKRNLCRERLSVLDGSKQESISRPAQCLWQTATACVGSSYNLSPSLHRDPPDGHDPHKGFSVSAAVYYFRYGLFPRENWYFFSGSEYSLLQKDPSV